MPKMSRRGGSRGAETGGILEHMRQRNEKKGAMESVRNSPGLGKSIFTFPPELCEHRNAPLSSCEIPLHLSWLQRVSILGSSISMSKSAHCLMFYF